MKYLILANGEYGDFDWYRKQKDFDRIICADAGASWALQIGLKPHLVIGDLDSINEQDRKQLEEAGCGFQVYPPEKDFTDTHLALMLAGKEGASDVTIWGGTGSRLDHTLGNLYCAASLSETGVQVHFASPTQTIYFVRDHLRLAGSPGETVSVIAVGDRATGVTLEGFYYPLSDVVLEVRSSVGISNVITEPNPLIQVAQGTLAVFHYPFIRK